jgi:hypothetical protein
MLTKTLLLLSLNLSAVLSNNNLRELKKARTCPSCPQCTTCDTKRGTCSLPLTGTVCQINNLSGVCSAAGVCISQTSVPPVPLKKCQTYNCQTGGSCTITYLNDGSDCTFVGNAIHSYCINDGCKAIIEALPNTLPAYNMGCLGLPDGVLCDTNLNLFDGETCQNEICKMTNGQYNGVLPP